MTAHDVALRVANGSVDLVLENGNLLTEDGLETAILASLFSHARAGDEDELPDGSTDRRGWWARDTDDPFGSLLWLQYRSKLTTDTLELAAQAARDALDWLVRDNIADEVTVVPLRSGDRLLLEVTITRGTDPDFAQVWDAVESAAFDVGTSAAVRVLFRT